MRRSIVSIMMLLAVFVLSGIVDVAQEDNAQANKETIQIAIADYNAGNRDAIYDLLTEPFMMNAGDNVLYETSKAENTEWDIALDGAMPDRQMNADMLIAQGDWVAMHVTYTGTFTEPYSFTAFGLDAFEPTNEIVTWTETDFLHFNADGLIDQVRVVSDPSPLFEQLGIFPPMGDEEDPVTSLEHPVGYQTLSSDELSATYSTGMEDRNLGVFQAQADLGLGTDDSHLYADTYISWNNGLAIEYVADVQVEEDMAFTGMIATAMPDYVIETPVVVAEGDWVASLVHISGTFTDDTNFFGTPLSATGEPVFWQLGIIQRYDADGKIIEIWNETDPLSLFVGLGLMSMDEE